MPKALLSGAAGFIGACCAEHLLKEGWQVVGLDDLNPYYDPRLKLWRLQRLRAYRGFSFHQVDISDPRALAKVLRGRGGFDAVFHLAARAGVRASIKQPEAFARSNFLGTLQLLELAARRKVGKFILASTSSAYGAGAKTPFTEGQCADRPLSPYGATKRAAELLGYAYHHLYGMDMVVLRYFTVYGPAGRPDMSYFRFMKQILRGRAITVYGDGTQRRDFTYIEDVVRGTVAALDLRGYHVLNLGSDRPVPLRHLIALIEQALGRKARIRYAPRHPADAPATWASIQEAKRLLRWRPQVPLQEGIGLTAQWFLKERALVESLRD